MIHDLSQSNIFTQHEIIIKVLILPQEVLSARFHSQTLLPAAAPHMRYLTMAVNSKKQAFMMFTITENALNVEVS